MNNEKKHLQAILSILNYIEKQGLDNILQQHNSLHSIESLLALVNNNVYEGLGLDIPNPYERRK